MTSRVVLRCLALLVVLVGGGSMEARAQNNRFTERSFVSSPVVLGMGDAGVALVGPEQAFFYNPAHLPAIPSHFTVLGVQGSASRALDDQIRFLNDRLNPAVTSGENRGGATLAALRREALALPPGRGEGGVVLPSFVYSPGAFGIGGGIFAKTSASYRIEPDGDEASVWTLSRTDFMALVSMGLDLRGIGLDGFAVGGTVTQTRRFLAFKAQTLRQFRRREPAVTLVGGTFQLDVGATYRLDALVPMRGTLRLGGAIYDVLSDGYGYATGGPGRLPFLNEVVDQSSSDDLQAPTAEVNRARRLFSLRPSYRVGLAYQRGALSFLEDVGLAADYQGYRGGAPAPLSRVHLGAQATVVGPLRVRGGLSAGYPSGGLGVGLGAFRLDYALHGVEEGDGFREQRTYVHTARVMVRLD